MANSEKGERLKMYALSIFLGFHVLSTYATVISLKDVWVFYFGESFKTFLFFAVMVPPVLVFPFVAKVLDQVGDRRCVFINISVQAATCFVLVLVGFICGQEPYDEDSGRSARNYVAVVLLVIAMMVFQTSYAIAQSALYSIMSEFSQKTTKVFITGTAMPNIMIALFRMLVDLVNKSGSALATLISMCSFLLFIYVSTFFAFKSFVKRFRPEQRSESESVYEIDEESSFSIYKRVAYEKKRFLILNALMFYFTFLVFPDFMLSMKSGSVSGIVLLLIFGFAELISRLINTFGGRFLDRFTTKGIITCMVFVHVLVCFVPLFNFLVTKKVINVVIADKAIGILNMIFYFLIAFGLGFIGNSIAVFVFEGLSGRKMHVAGALYSTSIVCFLLFGSLSSFIIRMSLDV